LNAFVIPPAVLRGEGLQPYAADALVGLFDWAENPAAGSRHAMPHRGRFLIDVVEIEANAVHQPNKPGDEIVHVLEGRLTLTDDGGGQPLVVPAGSFVLIPEGWAGLYRVEPGERCFRELAIVPHDYFANARRAAPSGASPRLLDLAGEGRRELHRGRYAVEVETFSEAGGLPRDGMAEEILVVVEGEIVVNDTAIAAGGVAVLSEGSAEEPRAAAGARVLRARWL
jgi:quercetin dioxygenase-like cupin family protein